MWWKWWELKDIIMTRLGTRKNSRINTVYFSDIYVDRIPSSSERRFLFEK